MNYSISPPQEHNRIYVHICSVLWLSASQREVEVFVEVMGCLPHWSCLGKGFVNVSNVQTMHLWVLLCGWEGGGRKGGLVVVGM